jgi:hypothetical protein
VDVLSGHGIKRPREGLSRPLVLSEVRVACRLRGTNEPNVGSTRVAVTLDLSPRRGHEMLLFGDDSKRRDTAASGSGHGDSDRLQDVAWEVDACSACKIANWSTTQSGTPSQDKSWVHRT